MTIRAKLYVLVTGSIVLFALTAVIYFWVQAPIQVIEKERSLIGNLLNASLRYQIGIGRVTSEPLATATENIVAARDSYVQAFGVLEGVTYLPTINQELNDAVSSLKAVHELSESHGIGFVDGLTGLLDMIRETQSLQDTMNMFDLIAAIGREPQDQYSLIFYNASSTLQRLNTIQEIMTVSSGIIADNTGLIDQEIVEIKDVGSLVAIVFVVIIVASLMLVSIFIARSITRSIRSLVTGIEAMGTGRLTQGFFIRSRDEVGVLSRHLDTLLEKLRDSLGNIKISALKNHAMKDHLQEAVAKATSSAVEIAANSDSIKTQMQSMDEMVRGASTELGDVAGSINAFVRRIAGQGQKVSGATATVSQILSSLNDVGHLVDSEKDSAQRLVQANEEGREVFEDSFAKVGEISSSVGLIQDMADVIANVASQTNILAMNATIEAAHAGEFGKGFAVVADEISKLAAASTTSSAEIAHSIAVIVKQIDEALATKEHTTKAFAVISQTSADVSDSIAGLHEHFRRIEAGSTEVLQTMKTLNEDSDAVHREAGLIDNRTRRLVESFDGISRVSHEVVSNIGEISLGLQEINRSIIQVNEQSGSLGNTSDALSEAVEVFTIEDVEIAEAEEIGA